MVLERLLIADMQKISGTVERKIAAVGVTRLLCDCPPLMNGAYARFWLVNFSYFFQSGTSKLVKNELLIHVISFLSVVEIPFNILKVLF